MPTAAIDTAALHPLTFRGSPFLASFRHMVSVNPQWQWLKDGKGSELGIADALRDLPVGPNVQHPFADEASATQAAIQIFYQQHSGRIWAPTDALEALLQSTDLDESLPTSFFRSTEQAVYIAFGSRWRQHLSPADLPGMLAFADTSAHVDSATPVGCYVFQSRVLDLRINDWVRNIGIHQVFAPHGNAENGPVPECMIGGFSVPIDDENAPITETIARAWQASIHGAYDTGAKRWVDLLAKLMLYRQCIGARAVEHNEYTDEAQRLSKVGAKKAAKLERRLSRLYDWTEVGPLMLPQPSSSGNGDSDGVAPHWRRGHFRMQAHGPQQVLRKLIFIAPTLVREDRLVHEEVPTINRKAAT